MYPKLNNSKEADASEAALRSCSSRRNRTRSTASKACRLRTPKCTEQLSGICFLSEHRECRAKSWLNHASSTRYTILYHCFLPASIRHTTDIECNLSVLNAAFLKRLRLCSVCICVLKRGVLRRVFQGGGYLMESPKRGCDLGPCVLKR